MTNINEKKAYIKEAGKCNRVRELVDGLDMEVTDAVDYVYDMLTLTNDEFAHKYNIY